jgi:putative acetyltransferase
MVRVRPSRLGEDQRTIAIWRASVDATHDFLTPEDRLAIDAEAQAYLGSARLWVAVDPRDRPLAFMGLDQGRLESLFVDPAHRAQGVGRTLVSFAAFLHPILETEVNAQNEQAVGFYRRLGFVEVRHAPTDDQGRPYPIILMRLETAPGSSGS